MRVVYAGTPEFAARSLEALIVAGYPVVAVLTQPDRPTGRGFKVLPGAVKRVALASHVPVYQPERLASPDMQTLPVKIFASLRQDLSPVIAAVSTCLVGATALLMLFAALVRRVRT